MNDINIATYVDNSASYTGDKNPQKKIEILEDT